AAISGRTVSFTVGTGASAQTCSGSTDFAGNANCSVTLAQSATATSLPVVAGFAGDTFYAAATDKGTIAIEYMTGRAYDVAATGLLPLGPIGDTGPVAVNGPKSVTPCVLPLVSPVSGGVLCSSVVTSTGPDTSKASASVASLAIGATGGLPDIAVKAVEADSSTTCSKTSGTTTIAYLKIGSTVVIVSPTAPAPNTV